MLPEPFPVNTMDSFGKFRRLRSALVSGVLLCALAVRLPAAPRGWQSGTPPAQRGGYGQRGEEQGRATRGLRPGQEHLSQWMNHHSSLPVPDQQRALEREPGFRDLSPQVQQRMRERLTQLNNMPPQQRQRVLDRAEVIEHLAPEQRQRVRGTMQQLSSLPEDRRRAVSRAFRELRNLPPEQRQEAIASGRFSSDFSPEERSTLNRLNEVEPLLPPAPAQRYPDAGGLPR
jgi:hypothetical protein